MTAGIEHIQVAIADYQPHPRNYNEHPDPQIAEIAESLKVFGQVKPVVVWREWYIAGHGVVLGAQRLGWTQLKAERLPADWPEYKALAYLAADNELARGASPNLTALAALAKEVQAQDAGLGRLAAGGEDGLRRLAALMADEPPEDPGAQIDRAEELREKWGVEPGQLWRLGEHKLICGDCTDAGVVARVMDGEKADFVFADPPYGVNIVAANVSVGGGEGPNGMIPFGGKKRKGYVGGGEGDSLRHGHYAIEEHGAAKRLGSANGAKPFGSRDVRGSIGATNISAVGKYAPVVGDETAETARKSVQMFLDMWPGAVHVWWGANYYSDALPPSSCWLVWNKETTGNFADCELAWTNQDRAAKLLTHRWNGMLRDSERQRRWHPTQKPAALAAWAYRELGKQGDVAFDPFLGCGPSLVAAEQTGRKLRGVEVSADYVAVAIQRWVDMTGGVPELVQDD